MTSIIKKLSTLVPGGLIIIVLLASVVYANYQTNNIQATAYNPPPADNVSGDASTISMSALVEATATTTPAANSSLADTPITVQTNTPIVSTTDTLAAMAMSSPSPTVQPYDFSISVSGPGSDGTYTLNVTNTGTQPDTYGVFVDSDSPYTSIYGPENSGTVQPGDSWSTAFNQRQTSATIGVMSFATSSNKYLTVTNPNIKPTPSPAPMYDFIIDSMSVPSMNWGYYGVTVTNTGTMPDTYTIVGPDIHIPGPGTAGYICSSGNVTVQPGGEWTQYYGGGGYSVTVADAHGISHSYTYVPDPVVPGLVMTVATDPYGTFSENKTLWLRNPAKYYDTYLVDWQSGIASHDPVPADGIRLYTNVPYGIHFTADPNSTAMITVTDVSGLVSQVWTQKPPGIGISVDSVPSGSLGKTLDNELIISNPSTEFDVYYVDWQSGIASHDWADGKCLGSQQTSDPIHFTVVPNSTAVIKVTDVSGLASKTWSYTFTSVSTPTPTPTATATPTPLLPVAGFTVSPQSGPAPLDVFTTDTSAGAISYQWNFGDHTPNMSTQSPAHTYSNPGTYTIVQTVYNSAGSSTATMQITVSAAATPTPTPSPVVLPWDSSISVSGPDSNNVYTLTVTNTGTQPDAYGVFVDSGSPSAIIQGPVSSGDVQPGASWSTTFRQYQASATFGVMSFTTSQNRYFTVTDANITPTLSPTPEPTGSIRGSTHGPNDFSAGAYVTDAYDHSLGIFSIISLPGEAHYGTWRIDNLPLNVPLTVHGEAGPYNATTTVTLTPAQPDQGVSFNWVDKTKLPTPVAGFNISTTGGVTPLTVYLTDASKYATSYQWNFGDNTPNMTAQDPVYTYTDPGTYTITQTVYNYNGSSTTTATVYAVAPSSTPTPTPSLPVAGFSISPASGQAPLDVFTTDTSTGAAWYQWNFGDHTPNMTTQSPAHTYSNPGNYTITQTVYNSNGSATATRQVTASAAATPTPTPSPSPSPSPSPAPMYDFRFGSLRGPQVMCWPYWVVSIVNTGTMPDTYTASGDIVIPDPGSAGYIGSTGNATVEPGSFWSQYFLGTKGNGVVTVTDAHGISHSYTYAPALPTPTPTVTPAPILPVAGFSASPTSGPAPLNVYTTDGSSGATSYQWNFGDHTPNATTKNSAHTYSNPGTYTIALTVSNSAGSSTTTKQVTVSAVATPTPTTVPVNAPVAGFTISPQSGRAPLDVFTTDTSTGATSYQWNFGDHTPNATTRNPAHTYPNPGVYTVLLTVYNSAGSSTATRQVTVNAAA